MLGAHKSIVIPQGTGYAQEMRKWEATHTQFGPPGRPYHYLEFPKMLYRASRGDRGPEIAERVVVQDEGEQRNMQSRGFHLDQPAALAALAAEETDHAKLAAERNWEIAHGRLSPAAAAEVRAAEAEHGARHLPAVPETPVRRRGRPRKIDSTV